MDPRRLGIFHQRYSHTISETTRAIAPRHESAAEWFFIFYRGIARFFSVAGCTHFSFESPARGGPCGTPALQTSAKIVGQARRLASRSTATGAVALQQSPDVTISNLSNPSRAFAQRLRCLRRTG